MTDLVERLRTYDPDVDSPDVVSEAADEIERLRRGMFDRSIIEPYDITEAVGAAAGALRSDGRWDLPNDVIARVAVAVATVVRRDLSKLPDDPATYSDV